MNEEYKTPQLEDFGTVTDLTQVGNTKPGGDLFHGSVIPPGHKSGELPGPKEDWA